MSRTTPPPAPYAAASDYVAWLHQELPQWQADGIITEAQAAQLAGRYVGVRRLALSRIMLTLGAAFVGVGVIWLVASNLKYFPPVARLGIVATFWIALTVVAEWLAARRETHDSIPSPMVGAARILAVLGFAATLAQASQSLNVPAFEPRLLGLFGAGALVYAYTVRAVTPALLGVASLFGWIALQAVFEASEPLGILATVLAAGAAGIAFSAVHVGTPWRDLQYPWRELGWVGVLISLFICAVPDLTSDGWGQLQVVQIGALVALALAAALGVWRGASLDRWDVLIALSATGIGVALTLWEPELTAVTAEVWAHAALAVVAYVLIAGWVAVSGTVRDNPRLIGIGLAAVVVFTTFQSWAVFSPLMPGAVLFVVLGVIFLATGYVFDRARRRVAAQLDDPEE